MSDGHMTVQFAREASSSGDVYGSPACNTGCVVDRSKASLLVKACGLPNTANWWTAKQDVNDIFSTPAWPLPVCLCCRCCLERRGDTRTSQGVWRVFLLSFSPACFFLRLQFLATFLFGNASGLCLPLLLPSLFLACVLLLFTIRNEGARKQASGSD